MGWQEDSLSIRVVWGGSSYASHYSGGCFRGRFLKGLFLVACQRVDYLFTVCMYCPIAGLGHTGTSIIARMFQGSAWR